MSDHSQTIALLREASALDFRLLAHLHTGEITQNDIEALKACPFSERLGLVVQSEKAVESLKLLDVMFRTDQDKEVFELSDEDKSLAKDVQLDNQALLDHLAADYAAIYLNHQFDASPLESVWLDDDHLMYQKPMFNVRRWYENFGLGTPDWRIQSDDHLALQLEFIAHLLEQKCDGNTPLKEAAQFMDEHLLLWIGDFANSVARRCHTPFYAGLAILTESYLQDFREQVLALADYPRPEIKKKVDPIAEPFEKTCGDEPENTAYLPGLEPSW